MHRYNRRKPKYKEIAPTKPAMFNGEANILKFHRYMSQCERYLDEGNVPKYDRVAKCSDFLEGKAYKYYSTEVSFNEEQWSTERFFQGLFNYCFPPDFKLKQRERLERFNQRDRQVREYAAELKIIYQTIGHSTKCERVMKLWSGLRPELDYHRKAQCRNG